MTAVYPWPDNGGAPRGQRPAGVIIALVTAALAAPAGRIPREGGN